MANCSSIIRLILIAAVAAALAAHLPDLGFDIVSPAWADDDDDNDDDNDEDDTDQAASDAEAAAQQQASDAESAAQQAASDAESAANSSGSGSGSDSSGSGSEGNSSGSGSGSDSSGSGSEGDSSGSGSGGGKDTASGDSSDSEGSGATDSGTTVEDASATAVSSAPVENDDDNRRGLNFFAGLVAYEQGDYDNATKHWLPLAVYGHTRSQAGLGALYYNSALFADAFRWSRAAARQGDRDAAHNLAVMYQYGLGTPFRMSRAMFWYGEAAAHGHRKATLALRELRGEPLAAYLAPVPIPKPEAAERLAGVRLTEEAQIHLATLGYDPGPIDGRYGAQTKAAVEQFERDRGLFVRGRVNEALLINLRRAIVDESVTTISSS